MFYHSFVLTNPGSSETIIALLNLILTKYHTPLLHRGIETLKSICAALQPFKKAVKNLCRQDANHSHADRIIKAVLEDHENLNTKQIGRGKREDRQAVDQACSTAANSGS